VCPIWLFEDDVFGSEVEPFKSEIRRQGMRFALIRSESLHPGFPLIVDGHEIQDYDCVLVQAGHQTFRQAVLLDQWLPVGWCTLPHFACSVYYPHFAEFLLNRDYRIGAVAELMSESLPDEVFIRPDSGMKTFTGRRISIATLPHAIPHLPFYPDTKVVIARTRRIDREWRLVIVGDTVLAASQYFVAGQPSLAQGCPNEVRSFAERMLARVLATRSDIRHGHLRSGRHAAPARTERLQLFRTLPLRSAFDRRDRQRHGNDPLEVQTMK